MILAQNPETASRFRESRRVTVLPNALLAARSIGSSETNTPRQPNSSPASLVMAGRLIGLKAPALALMALAHIHDQSTTLSVYGEGPQTARLARLARRLGVEHRVHFHGLVPRDELMTAIASASALLHPALHEEGGFVIVEALTSGTPVVAIDRGGPPVIGEFWPRVPSRFIAPSTPAASALALAVAINDVIGLRTMADPTPAETFRLALLDSYAEAVGGRSR